MPLFEHLQREQKLLAELLLAAPEIGLRRKRADRAMRHLRGAVIGLARPDRQHDRARHAEALLDLRQRRAMLFGKRAALRGEPVERGLLQVLGGRLHEFGLRGLAVRPAGNHEIGQRKIRLEAARRRIEGRARHAELLRIGP